MTIREPSDNLEQPDVDRTLVALLTAFQHWQSDPSLALVGLELLQELDTSQLRLLVCSLAGMLLGSYELEAEQMGVDAAHYLSFCLERMGQRSA